jgi:hypothetical protein
LLTNSLDVLTNVLTLSVVNKSFSAFNELSRVNHFERFERLHRSEWFKKIYLMRRSIERSMRSIERSIRSIELFKTFNMHHSERMALIVI